MSTDYERRVETIKAFYAAGPSVEPEQVIEFTDPEIVADWSRSRGLGQGVYRGRAEVQDFFAGMLDVFDEIEFFHDEFIEAGEGSVIRVGGIRARGKGSGTPFSAKGAQVFEFDGDVITSVTLYQDREEALDAAGLERP